MGEVQQLYYLPPPPLPTPPVPPPPSSSSDDPPPPPSSSGNETPHPRFNPSRMIGIIRRKALIKDLAAVYHAECLSYCQDLLELQRKFEEQPYLKIPEIPRKENDRPTKRMKKSR